MDDATAWQGPTPALVICQDCLAVAPFTVARHTDAEACPCGGQWCGCDTCTADAARLMAGERDAARLALIDPAQDLTGWTPERGLRR